MTRVVNLQGPQTQVSQFKPDAVIKREPEEDPGFFTGIEERLQNIESHLKVDKRKLSKCRRLCEIEQHTLFSKNGNEAHCMNAPNVYILCQNFNMKMHNIIIRSMLTHFKENKELAFSTE